MDRLYVIILLVGLLVLSVAFVWLLSFLVHKHKKLSIGADFVNKILPGVDCGMCGEKNCTECAKKVAAGQKAPEACKLLKEEEVYKIKKYIKPANSAKREQVAIVKCKGGKKAVDKYFYKGLDNCAVEESLHSGCKECKFACLGCGDCVRACRFGAIKINERGTAEVVRSKCVGCGACVKSCPNQLVTMQNVSLSVQAICNNKSSEPGISKKCEVGCSHCGNCIKVCPVGAVQVIDNVPVIDATKCISCYRCVAACPHHVISRL